MYVSETVSYNGRQITLSWDGSNNLPPKEQITQVSGYCFTEDGLLVIVAGNNQRWALPGGHPEAGETLEETLRREVWEEACAIVQDLAYMGAQRVDDPQAPDGLTTYYQTRFWARIQLESFLPLYEISARLTVEPAQLFPTLQWSAAKVAQALFVQAQAYEQWYTQQVQKPTMR